ncbi:MAG TPA: lysine-sensitive aspartokinase 3 [Pyrinomonadaceae bacterium]|nr:lysine-sensitive aspartokinase 3 [Pyrinomonadaceae bacterium]
MAIIMKFGGTSVADAAAFENVARIVTSEHKAAPVVVVSAMSGVTDSLLNATKIAATGDADQAIASLENVFKRHHAVAHELLSNQRREEFLNYLHEAADQIAALLKQFETKPDERKALQDAVVSFGEMLSSTLLAAVLNQHDVEARPVDARRCIITDDEHTSAAPLMTESSTHTQNELRPVLEKGIVPVLGGFIGATIHGVTTTLGRGGSDYTAALLGALIDASEIQIWTDVTGVLTADPRVVPHAHTVEILSYGEAAELAYFGAKVLHPKTIQPAIVSAIPVRICNSRAPEVQGTVVGPLSNTTPRTIKAIAHKNGVTVVQITSLRMLGAFGFLRALFEVFDRHRTVVDVVTTSEVSVSLSLDEPSALPAIVEELEQLGTVKVEKKQAIICVVGEGLRGTPGVAARAFSTITDINVSLISQGASSINFTFVVDEERVQEVVTRLHEEFFGPQKST